jgi:hypothetical protein
MTITASDTISAPFYALRAIQSNRFTVFLKVEAFQETVKLRIVLLII